MITHAGGIAHLERGVAAFAGLLAEADPAAGVPTCPEWTVADLVVHLGEVHRWARHAIVAGNPDGRLDPPAANDRATMLAWYTRCADELVSTLRGVDGESPAWTFGAPPRTARFWSRRQAHEAAVHSYDLARAVGRDYGYDRALATDGIEELVTVFFPRQVRLGRIAPLDRSLTVRVPGFGQVWMLAKDGVAAPDLPTDAELVGPAPVVLLALWGRIGLDDPRLRVNGDVDAARAVLTAGIVP